MWFDICFRVPILCIARSGLIMKKLMSTSMVALGLVLMTNVAPSWATNSQLNSTSDTLTVTGYSNTASGGKLAVKSLSWYSGSGYGLSSTSSETNNSPEHAVDNNGYKESLLLNFGAANSTQLDKVTIGWNGGNDTDITVLAWKPSQYMDPSVSAATIAAPTLVGATYGSLINAGWSLVGNYSNLAPNIAKSVNVGDAANGVAPVSSSYWLVMTYNSLIGAAPNTSSDPTAKKYTSDASLDYGKFLSVSYSPGTKTPPHGVPEPSSALLLGAALFGFVGWRSRRMAAK